MPGKRHFRSLTNEMEADIIACADREVSGNRIHTLLVKRYGERAPKSRQTVYNFLRWLALQERPELDEWTMPWTLGAMVDPKCNMTWADAALVVTVCHRVCDVGLDREDFPAGMYSPNLPSVAEARWIAHLSRLAPAAKPLAVYLVAVMYANAERLWGVRGETFNSATYDKTIDLDSPEPFAETVEMLVARGTTEGGD